MCVKLQKRRYKFFGKCLKCAFFPTIRKDGNVWYSTHWG